MQSQDAGHEGPGLGPAQAGLHRQDGGARRCVRGETETEQVKDIASSLFTCSIYFKIKMIRIQPNKRLEKWLLDRAAQIKTLSLENASESSRLAVR